MVGESAGVVEAEHFETDCRAPSSGNQAPEHFSLELMMIRVVMPLA